MPEGASIVELRPVAPEPPAPEAAGPPPSSHPATTVALVVLTASAATGLARVYAGGGWVGPVATTAAAAHLVAWAARRARWGPWRSAAAGLLCLWCMTAWTLVPGALTVGLPLGRAAHALARALSDAGQAFPNTSAPVPTSTGFVLLAVVGVGVVALAGDWLALRVGSPLQAALPAVALLAVAGAAGTSRGRPWAVALVVGAVAGVLAVHGAEVGGRGRWWLAGRRVGVPAARAAAAIAAVAVLAAVVATPGSRHADGHGALGWKGGGPGGGGGASRVVLSPVVDLRTRLLQESGTPVFQVDSPVPSYWRLTSLDTFTGVQWEATASYHGVAGPLPGASRAAAGTRQVQTSFVIQRLSSIWMPTAFTPEAVRGGGHVAWDATSGSLLAGTPTSDGLSYSMTSEQYLSTLTPQALQATGPVTVDAAHSRYLQLPAGIPDRVYQLARTITAGAHDEFDAALRLQDFFVDNPAFSYSIDPPVDGYGTDALVQFLFATQTGYCQQFAGAYAVLARAAGLPTRLAVGFTTGTSLGGDRYQVRDADAHTWPEVWFGPSIGWLPFEPTKGDFAIPGAGYAGVSAGAVAVPQAPPTTTGDAPLATPKQGTPATTAPAAPTTRATAAAGRPAAGSGAAPVLAALGLVVAVPCAWALGVASVRRRRGRRRRRRAGPGAGAVLAAWAEVGDELSWRGLGRRPEETPAEHAARVAPRLRLATADPAAGARLQRLASAAALAAYGPGGDGDWVGAAVEDADRLRRALVAGADRAGRVARLLDPRAVPGPWRARGPTGPWWLRAPG